MFNSTSSKSRTGPKGPVLHGPSGFFFYAALIAGVLGFGLFFDHTAATTAPGEASAAVQADMAREQASPDVRYVAKWAVDTGDHQGQPFVVVDKEHARIFAFDGLGRLRASAPVLLGAVRGDTPEAPATPAGRFVADTWQTAIGEAMVWVNGDAALSLHALPSPASPGRALQRLASDQVEDRRISDGSLHVAGDFYQQFLAPLRGQVSTAYVLPDMQLAQSMFTRPAEDALRFAQWLRQPLSRSPS